MKKFDSTRLLYLSVADINLKENSNNAIWKK